jgi:hypothetical protein
MFDHLFENRNSTVTNLLKLGDCLGRSLRENVELFSIDSENKRVAFLTEGGKVLSGIYTLKGDITLSDLTIQNSEIFTDNDTFDTFVNEKVSAFVGNLNSNEYESADESFSNILSLWENRLKFENVKDRLHEKSLVFSDSQNIVGTEEFQRFLEVMPQFMTFLSENREDIEKVKEIENAIKLSNSVSKAFAFPKLSYDALEEQGSYTISKGPNKSVYELICKQELVRKELLESKKNFEDVWATNPKIRNLASLIFEDAEETVLEALVEAVVEVPYLALTTKKQLFESVNNAFGLVEDTPITAKEIKAYASKLFEMKKPLKAVIVGLLNEKYGINVQNLKESATFDGLANTQVVIFEALMRLAPKGSIVKETLANLSKMLRNKNGVEVIDINDLLQECFEDCNYNEFTFDFMLAESLDFDNLLNDEMTTAELLEKTKDKLLLDREKKEKGDEEDSLSPEQKKGRDNAEKHEKDPANDTEEEDDSVAAAEKKTPKEKKDKKDKKDKKEESVVEEGEEEASSETPEKSSETDSPQDDGEDQPEDQKPLTKTDFLDALKDMDELMLGISGDEEEEEVDKAETDETEA